MKNQISELHRELRLQAEALVADEPSLVANLANIAALLYHRVERLNWVGFYLAEHDQLVLGPFQGKPACVRIPWGKGVCGTAASTQETQRVADVHAFTGHIACDADSASEIVLPIIVEGETVAVLDIDSPEKNRFSAQDQQGFEALVPVIASLFKA